MEVSALEGSRMGRLMVMISSVKELGGLDGWVAATGGKEVATVMRGLKGRMTLSKELGERLTARFAKFSDSLTGAIFLRWELVGVA